MSKNIETRTDDSRIIYSGLRSTAVSWLLKAMKLMKPFILMHFGLLDLIIYSKFEKLLKDVLVKLKAAK